MISPKVKPLNKTQIVAITHERHLYFKKLINKRKHEKSKNQSKHSNLVRLICNK